MQTIDFIKESNPSSEAVAMYELIFELQKTYAEMMRFTDNIARSLGTTGPRILTLSVVAPGPATVSDIARRMDSSRQNIQRTTDALVENGLAEYIPNPNHRRAKLVQLTDSGSKAMREWARVGGQGVQKLAANVAKKRLVSAARTLNQIRRIVSELGP